MRTKIKKSQDARKLFSPAKSTGDLVKAFRKNFEIKQDTMAAACGISQANLSAIENGRREVGPHVALRLSAVMGLSLEIVLFPGGYQEEPEYQDALDRSAVIVPMVAKAR